MWLGAGSMLLFLLTVAFGWFVPNLRQSAQAVAGERIEVSFLDTPSWMTPTDLAPIQDLVAREAGISAYDRDGLVRAQSGLLASGWFEEVRQVRRIGSASLEVDATFADPIALVVDADGEHLLDSHARLLPRTYAPGTSPNLTRNTTMEGSSFCGRCERILHKADALAPHDKAMQTDLGSSARKRSVGRSARRAKVALSRSADESVWTYRWCGTAIHRSLGGLCRKPLNRRVDW